MIVDSLFTELKDRLIQGETFKTKAEASSRSYLIMFRVFYSEIHSYESKECRKSLTSLESEFGIYDFSLEPYSLFLEPMFESRELHQPSKNPLIRTTSLVNVTVKPTGYIVKPENHEDGKKLQNLIDDLFSTTPREKSTLPQGCLQRVRKNSSGHQ